MARRDLAQFLLPAALAATCGCAASMPAASTLEIGVPGRASGLDPARANGAVTAIVAPLVFATLPQIATKVARSSDEKHWRFTIAARRQFSDGTALDAAAIVANVARWRSIAGTARRLPAGLYARAAGSTTIEFGARATATNLARTLDDAAFGIASPAALARGDAAFEAVPVGSGNYVVASPRAGDFVELVARPGARTAYARIFVRELPDPRTALLSLEKDDLSVVYDYPPSDVREARSVGLWIARDSASGRLCAFPADLARRSRACPPGASTLSPDDESPAP